MIFFLPIVSQYLSWVSTFTYLLIPFPEKIVLISMSMRKVVRDNYLKNRKTSIMITYLSRNVLISRSWRYWNLLTVGLRHISFILIVFASHVTNPVMNDKSRMFWNFWWKFSFVMGFELKAGSKISNGFSVAGSELLILTANTTW